MRSDSRLYLAVLYTVVYILLVFTLLLAFLARSPCPSRAQDGAHLPAL